MSDAKLSDLFKVYHDLEKTLPLNFRDPVSAENFFDRGMLKIGLGDKSGGTADVSTAAEMGWGNAQRVLAGLRPVPRES